VPAAAVDIEVGAGETASITRRQQERHGGQSIEDRAVARFPDRNGLDGASVAPVKATVERRLIRDRDHAGQHRNPHQEIPVFINGQLLIERDVRIAQEQAGHGD